MTEKTRSTAKRWAEFRFAAIGPLLAAPPEEGTLAASLKELALREWKHPIKGDSFKISVPTLERWYYRAKNETNDVVASLLPKKRSDTGLQNALPAHWKTWLDESYARHKRWTWQLHSDELAARIRKLEPHVKPPSYTTVRRYMKAHGMFRARKKPYHGPDGSSHELGDSDRRETRSYEVEYVGGLWHTDFHHAHRRVLLENGTYVTPVACALIDDRSRLCCHLQWYAEESAEILVHTLSQAIQKRGLPRALMTDNGGPMATPEFREGFVRLGIVHELTRPYSPEQNAKVEVFWGIIEGRFMALLEKVSTLTLTELNKLTQAWVEKEYNRHIHRETKSTPYDRFLNDKNVLRPASSHSELANAFRAEFQRTIRRSDGTITINGIRYEIPSRLCHLSTVCVHMARWDMSNAHIVSPETGKPISPIHPIDKKQNANAIRRNREAVISDEQDGTIEESVPHLLQEYVTKMEEDGLPTAYLPLPRRESWQEN